MAVNEALAQNSTYAYTAAVTIYVLSMFFYLAEQAFGRRAAAKPARELVAAGGVTTTEPPEVPEDTGTPGNRPLTERGAGVHLASIVLRGFATHRWPLGNMYEFMSFVCLIAVAAWLFMLWRFAIRRLGAFVLIPVFILMFLGGTVLYTQAEPVQPALQSYWLVIHVTVVSTAAGILLVPGVASVLYLIRGAHDR